MANPTQPLPAHLCGASYEIWHHVLDYLEIPDVLTLRRCKSHFLKAVCEDHPTFCRDINFADEHSVELFNCRCEAAALRETRTINLDLDFSFNFDVYLNHLRFPTTDARSRRVSDVMEAILRVRELVRSLHVSICGEYFHLLESYLAQPAPMINYLSLGIVDRTSSLILRQLPPALFQGDAPLLHTVALGFIVPPAAALAIFPSVKTLVANTKHLQAPLPVPVGFQHMFPRVEFLALVGDRWDDSHWGNVNTIRLLAASDSLKHLRLDFNGQDETARLLDHIQTRRLESFVMVSAVDNGDSITAFIQHVADIGGLFSLTLTFHHLGRIEVTFCSTSDPHRSRSLELSLPIAAWGNSKNIFEQRVNEYLDLIGYYLKDAVKVHRLRVTELCIDIAACNWVIPRFANMHPEATKLVLVIRPEVQHQNWLSRGSDWMETALYPSGETDIQEDGMLQYIRTAELVLGNCTGTAEQSLSDRDTNTLVSLLKRMPHRLVPLKIGDGIAITAELRSALMNVSSLSPCT